MDVTQLGEFGLIARIQQTLSSPSNPDVLVGIGDDVAVLRADSDRVWLATGDIQVEGVHFMQAAVTPFDLGRKALAINLSDIGAKGGRPRFALVSLALPRGLTVEFVDELYKGLKREADDFGTVIVGGNISRSPSGLFVDIFLLGDAPRNNVVLRSGAHVGDAILVTGTLGDAAAGLALQSDPGLSATPTYTLTAKAKLALPTPRVREGEWIGASHLATAMLDVSDGLASDLGHICDASQVGARVLAGTLPVDEENRALARSAQGDEWSFALHGGEDYELLFTAPAANVQAIVGGLANATGTGATVVGEIVPVDAGRRLILPIGVDVPLGSRGWDHLADQKRGFQ
ncbi:MAG: thiamine-phosphate kinase [Chloroflexi bacterium]|nr:thiamine-phosphate kinase [Chloroflexota bacterium]